MTTLALQRGQTPQEAVALLERAISLAEGAGLLPQAARAEHNLGGTYWTGLGDPELGRVHYLRAAELHHRTGSPASELYTRVNAAAVTLYQGKLVSAQQELVALRQLQASLPDPATSAVSLSMLEADLLRYRGQLTEAAAHLQALRAELFAAGNLQNLADVLSHLAEVQFEMAEGEGEMAALEAIRASEQLSGASITPASLLIAWYAGCNELEKARSLLSRAREQAGAGRADPAELAWLLRAEAHLAAAEGRWPEALAALERVTAESHRIGARWYAAWASREWAEALLVRGEPGARAQALSLLGQAAAEFDAMGAPHYAEKAKRRMDELARG
jgi:tetratricopeptide (TPR) repeat protein